MPVLSLSCLLGVLSVIICRPFVITGVLMRNSSVVVQAREGWQSSNTVWGKIAVISFYSVLLFLFVLFMILVINPSSPALNFDCLLAHNNHQQKNNTTHDHDEDEWLRAFVRCWTLTGLFLVYYFGHSGALNRVNVLAMVVYVWLIWMLIAKLTVHKVENFDDSDSQTTTTTTTTCLPELMDAVYYKAIVLGLPTLAFVTSLLERYLAPISARETEPLVTVYT